MVKAAGNLEDSESDDGLGGGLLLKRKRTIHEIETERKEQEEWSNKQKKKRKKQDTEVGIEAVSSDYPFSKGQNISFVQIKSIFSSHIRY